MAKREKVEVMDNYRENKKYAGTPVNRVVLMGIELLCKPLELLDQAIGRRVSKVRTKRTA